MRILCLLSIAGCLPKSASVAPPPGGVDVVIVPGCPTEPNGHLSTCQWRRAAWAAQLYHDGQAHRFITSGGAAYTPYLESASIAAGMEALGVPADAIHCETQALHTDQNVGYSLAIARSLGYVTVGMASDPGHSDGMCAMATRWGWTCTSFPLIGAIDVTSVPDVVLPPIPRDRWIADHREPRMATSPSYRSIGHYTKVILTATFTGSRAPKPPIPEPTLLLAR
ncbi:MAG: YdcF family protein [Myxococcota bacterium]